MCGLVSIISKDAFGLAYKDKALFSQMLFSDMLRGSDSTGVFGVTRQGNVDLLKEASSSPHFLCNPEVKSFMERISTEYQIVVGHNRKATMGARIDDNAHPFIEDDICLVHNGTLTNHKTLSNKEVDSHAICHHISTDGYTKTLSQIEGAYALIWYNAAEKTLYITRNDERPLAMVETSKAIYLASEEKMLDWLLDRNDIKNYTITEVAVGQVYKFSLETKQLTQEKAPKKVMPKSQKHQHKYQAGTSAQQQPRYSQPISNVSSQQDGAFKATVMTYATGEDISWKLLDWESNEKSTKLIGETIDKYHTPVVCWVGFMSTPELSDIFDADYLQSVVSSCTYKPGVGTILYVRDPKPDILITSGNGVEIGLEVVKNANFKCCICKDDIDDVDFTYATVQTAEDGTITAVTCVTCEDNKMLNQNSGYYTGEHYGHC